MKPEPLFAGASHMALIILAVVLLGISIFTAVYFIKRERRILNRIQSMLDDAIAGKFKDHHLDESRVSAVENSMWRYLSDHQVAYQKLLKEKEQIQVLISDIAHQTVTPIANITLYSQLLEEQQALQGQVPGQVCSQDTAEELSAIREQVEKLDFLVECLVKLSRLETGIIKVNTKKQSIAPVLSAVKKQFLPKASNKEIELLVKNTNETAVFDLNWTIEAVANIIDNAVKYTPLKGRVCVNVIPYSFFLRIDITDNGPGIPESEQSSVFTRFYRSGTVGDKPGLGIGLYLTREVMKAQNGYVKLTSSPGEGSTFSLFLPREEMSQKCDSVETGLRY